VNTKDPKSIALQFNECINQQDIVGLSNLMTDDHAFIDRDNKKITSKFEMIKSWANFFRMFPKYKNTFKKVKTMENLVVMLGYAYWNEENSLDPAIWTARIENDKVAEWRIYYDNKESRKKFLL